MDDIYIGPFNNRLDRSSVKCQVTCIQTQWFALQQRSLWKKEPNRDYQTMKRQTAVNETYIVIIKINDNQVGLWQMKM